MVDPHGDKDVGNEEDSEFGVHSPAAVESARQCLFNDVYIELTDLDEIEWANYCP